MSEEIGVINLSIQNRDYSSDSSEFTETEEDNDDELLTFEQFLGLKTTPEKDRKVLLTIRHKLNLSVQLLMLTAFAGPLENSNFSSVIMNDCKLVT